MKGEEAEKIREKIEIWREQRTLASKVQREGAEADKDKET